MTLEDLEQAWFTRQRAQQIWKAYQAGYRTEKVSETKVVEP